MESMAPSSIRHEHEVILVELGKSIRQEDIAIQVENDVIASIEKIYGDDESIQLIPRVPESLRQGANGAFDPQVVSIGPYHWGKTQFEATEKHKRRFLAEFLNRFPGRCLPDLIKEIESLEPRLRSCYDKDIHMTSKNFVEMMLVDGCFLIEFSLQKLEKVLNVEANIPSQSWLLTLMGSDVFLLENQLPFFFIQHIYDIFTTATKENPACRSSSIQVALDFCGLIWDIYYEQLSTPITLQYQLPKTIHHYLHLYHSINFSLHHSYAPDFESLSSESPCPRMRRAWRRQLTIPSATELHDLGIKFDILESQPILFGIKFQRGVMEITPSYLSYFSARIIFNIVAFERFYFEVPSAFIAFYKFLDLLVNTSNDVALLRRHNIIHHQMGSDEEVALFFSHLTKGILNDRPNNSSELYDEVNEYCNIKWHRWRRSLIRDYCNSPWSTLGLVVGFILLAFTFVQSYMSLHSYFRPPHSQF